MAFALSIGLFLYFWVVGYPVAAALHSQRDLMRNALIAPGVGVSVTIYSIYVLSRLGLPVGSFSLILAIALLAVACAMWALLKPVLPARRLIPYVLIGIVAFLTTGWPLLTHGFAWLANLNQDVFMYVLDAHRLVDQGFLQAPDRDTWLQRSDWSVYYVLFAIFGFRAGTDLLLAWVITLTGKNGLMVYMPLLVALQVALIAAATALITTSHRYARLITAALMSVSAMLALGVYLQLLPQLLGMLMVALSGVLCLSRFYQLPFGILVRHVGLAAIVIATFVLSYPELFPFFSIAFVVYHAIDLRNVLRSPRAALTAFFALAITSIILIAPDFVGYVFFLLRQLHVGDTTMRLPDIFPYFLIPSGLATLWGLSFYFVGQDPWLDTKIVIGAVLCLASIVSISWLVRRREPVAVIAAVMAVLVVPLFYGDNGFGLFKLAMYAQPFLLSTLVLASLLLLRASR
jgi:hypothetical protein